ncbi:MAG: polyprenyl synthetase family protein [Alphaproteobacteria bacterium]|nr:polyprenyl synthetase family protein [Alphaproteobacteria bacterium]
MTALHKALRESAHAVNQALEALLPEPDGLQARVIEAMHYTTFAGGKRLRPFLVVTGAGLFEVPRESALRAAVAVELVHTYSLVHDDLPCMDDDDLRRGMPTLHVEFDEATAVLAGDALLTLAFEVLASERTHADPAVRCELIAELARAAGTYGMVGGQMMDLLAENRELDEAAIKRLQGMKTGALFAFACEAGAILGEAAGEAREALSAYARDLGLAFQIADDLLDAEGSAEALGKAVGKDAAAGKATFVSLLGLKLARTEAERLASEAKQHLDLFAEDADLLRDVADFVIRRRA